jgi:hypothetical protein
MIAVSAWSHCGHSNNRSSRPLPVSDIRASIMRDWQFEQRGRSIALSGNMVGSLAVMTRYGSGAGATTSQSPVDAQGQDGDNQRYEIRRNRVRPVPD